MNLIMKKIYVLFFVGLPGFLVSAQSPGGVDRPDLSMWVKANSGTSTSGGLVNTWNYANNGNSFTSPSTPVDYRPTLVSSAINFNPSVRFTGGTKYMDGPTGVNAPMAQYDDDYSVFAVWQSNSTTTFQRIWSLRTTFTASNDAFALSTWNGSAPGPGVYGDETGTAPYSHTITRGYTAGIWNISQLNLYNQPTNDLQITDDRNLSTGPLILNTDPGGSPNGALLRGLNNTVNRMGANFDASGPDGPLNGDIAEIIVYNGFPISGAERSRIFSYLALKYGITIKTNLLSSAGTTIWNATTNSSYNNAVFGLSLDNASDLSVTQSNSMETGSGNGTGQSGKANIVLSNPSALTTDGTFLIVGNDNGGLTETTTEIPTAAAGSKRLAREWKVQRTGNPGTINMSFNLTGLSITGSNAIDFRLMIDADGDGNFTTGTIRYYTPSSYSAGVVSFTSGITLNNNEVFALITSASGSTPLPVTWKTFTAKIVNGNVLLDWVVANNESAKLFEIEHSSDGITFNQAGTVPNQTNVKSYSFVFPALTSGNHYFRIRQVDIDGKATYSKIVSVKGPDIIIRLLNNPVRNNYIDVQINAIRSSNATIELRSVSGAAIVVQQAVIAPGINRIKIPMNKAAAGNYLLKLQTEDMILTEKILKL